MKTLRKSNFIEGAMIATIAIFFTKFLGIVYVIPFYNIVGVKGGALYGYAYNIYNLFLIISSAGIPLAISKLTSEYTILKKEKEKEYLYYITKTVILVFSIISFIVLFIFAPTFAELIMGDITGGNSISDITFVIRCVSFAVLVVPMLSISRGFLQGQGYIKPASFSQVIEQIVRVIVILAGSYMALNVFHTDLKTAVGVSVFGACAGAIIAYLYLIRNLLKVKKENVDIKDLKKEERTVIVKKIIAYSIPFIVINIANSLYTSMDMILLIRGLNILKFDIVDIENISSVFTTWGTKINTIVTSIATGVAVVLVPSIAKSKALNNLEEINTKFNKTIQIFLYIALPLSIFISIFATQVWLLFYSPNEFGEQIVKLSILVAAIDALYIMICNGLQGLNKSKLIYLSVGSGLLVNLILDIPLMLLFNYIGIYPYYGAIIATLIGYAISLIIPFKSLKNEFKLNFDETLKKIPKLFFSFVILIIICLIYRAIISNVDSRLLLILLLAIIGVIALIIYLAINKKELEELLGKKLKFKKEEK